MIILFCFVLFKFYLINNFFCLQPYKYLLATRLIDYGKNTIALQYLESIATDLLKNENNRDMNLMQNVLELAERIKYSDSKSYFVDSSVDNSWLTSLHQLVNEVCNFNFFINVFKYQYGILPFTTVQVYSVLYTQF